MSYLSLEEAAAKLGISTDRLVELRSQGQVRGFRDGSSWKFPDTEIDRLADELADGFGSGILVGESGSGSGSVIGGDSAADADGSDLGIGSETPGEGSDVNLVTGTKEEGSDVELVASDSGKLGDELEQDSLFESDENALQEIDSAELKLNDPALMDDSVDSIDVAIDPKEGSTGPVAKAEIQAEADKISISDVDVTDGASSDDEFAFAGSLSEDDSDDLMLGEDSDSLDLDSLSEDELQVKAAGASSLELMNELDSPDSGEQLKSSGADVLSELDLLGAEQSGSGSGLISGDSENLLTSSGLGSGLGSSVINEMDDALDEDDDLVIADDDADLMLDSVSDISVAGDSGINLMSPSDSGLSLESEPLDLAGSSLSALDLGAELTDGSGISGSSGKNAGGSGAGSDEEFQLSPSGVGLDADLESSSQVIEVEDSELVGEAVDFQDDFADDAGFADAGFSDAEPLEADAFEESPAGMDGDVLGGEAIEMDEVDESPSVGAVSGMGGYEVPFSMLQCLSLMFIILTLSLGGMLMTDLVRNMWTYNDISSPVSALTDSLIGLMGWDS
ncbi:DNA-binding protein [Rhodopirellula sp. SM50]|nr:helix-turn-helix domain-containing protein [Rhodopirellula sp. SM50]PAY20228.1 DNA-binding protein [Rhodopirellula sp. SM50]